MSSAPPRPGLGSLLRALIDALDSDVEGLYRAAGEPFRPRYYPIARALFAEPHLPVSRLAAQLRVTHSAVSQTVSQMVSRGLLRRVPGKDARERRVTLTAQGRRVCRRLWPLWQAIQDAAAELDAELRSPLSAVVQDALAALARRPFGRRVEDRRGSRRSSGRSGAIGRARGVRVKGRTG